MLVKNLEVVGWREWIRLDELKIPLIKAKIDTGARTSSLHAYDLKFSKINGVEYVKFKVHPEQRKSEKVINCKSRVEDYRKVKSSNGQVELRPVILTKVKLGDQEFKTEITLTNRDEMGFRMLIGRQALSRKFLVNVGKSHLGIKGIVKKNKGRKN